MIRPVLSPAAVLAMAACGMPFWTPPPPTPAPIDNEDPRRSVVGTWEVQILLDPRFRPQDAPNEVTGLVIFTDTVIRNGPPGLVARVDLDPAVGCFDPSVGTVQVTVKGDSVRIAFPSTITHCGIWLVGTLHADTISGAWPDFSRGGLLLLGRFNMTRIGGLPNTRLKLTAPSC